MSVNRGELLKNTVLKYRNEQRMSISALSKKAGYDQSTIYRHFTDPDLPDHILLRWGKTMGHDFRLEIPGLGDDFALSDEDRGTYELTKRDLPPQEPVDQENEIIYWRTKYVSLLERFSQLLEDKLCEERSK